MEDIKSIIKTGELVTTELKEASIAIPKNLFETVCSFLNTAGGYIILGVKDNKEIIGIKEEHIEKIKKEYVSLCNNKQIIEPTIISSLSEIEIDGKIVLYTYIDVSSEIHKTKGKIFIRNYEGDFDITDNIPLIANLHNSKRKIFDEDTIYPYVSIESDLRKDLIEKARKLANSNVKKRHAWMDMTDIELLKSAGLYKVDRQTGREGITLAGVMLFGKDEIISEINPYCRTDALYRVDDLDRYDDRDFIETNLLDMYDRLLDFIDKYTMDRFALDENARRISPRNIMAREMVINTIMHRDIKDGHTSRIIIYKDKIVCENPNTFATMGILTLKNYTPFAKNPTLAKFFREIGYADELGSGLKKIIKNSILYSGKMPIFEDKLMFTLTIPLLRDENLDEKDLINLAIGSLDGSLDGSLNGSLNNDDKVVLDCIKENSYITAEELSKNINMSVRKIYRIYKKLKEKGYIERVGTRSKGSWKKLK